MSNKHHYNRINQWAKYLGLSSIENLDWVPLNLKKIVDFIEKTGYSTATKESHLFTLVKVLKEYEDNRVQQVLQLARQYLTHNNKQRNNQTMDEAEIKNWKDHFHFKKKFLEVADDGTVDSLILGLYTMIPPIRNDYNAMRVVIDEDPFKFKGKEENYIVINSDGFYLVMNDYKTKKIYGSKVIDLIDNRLPIEILKEIQYMKKYIENSIKASPREYLLGEKPLTKRQVILGLERNFKEEGIRPTIGIMRSSYVTWIYDNFNRLNVKKAIAEIMGHDVNTAERDYYKPR